MRTLVAAIAMILSGAGVTGAFEIEEQQVFSAPAPETRRLSILSTTDTEFLEPAIRAFQAMRPDVSVHYTVSNSTEVFAALFDEAVPFDLAISSAMDLQMKLANDGFATSHRSTETLGLPDWARWQDSLFAFAQEPVVTIVSRRAFDGLQIPQTRRDLIEVMRDNPERFRDRVGTYDPTQSGAGYLFATQDSRQSDSFWRLAEVMGALRPKLYSTSAGMISDLQSGRLVIAYNVLGSYASPRLPEGADGIVIEPADYTLTLLRTGLIPHNAANPDLGGAFIDFLLGPAGRAIMRDQAGLPPIDAQALMRAQHLRPIRLDPGLLVYLDQLKRRKFMAEWSSALIQP